MPTYEYKCRSCAHAFELFQSMSESPKRKCPACGRQALDRLIGTGAAVLFKGSGFYQTDYRSESYKKAAEAETKPAQTKASTPAEGKPAEGKATEGNAASGKPADSGKPAQTPAPPARLKPGPDRGTCPGSRRPRRQA